MTYAPLNFLSSVLSSLAAVPLLAYCKVCSLVPYLGDELAKGHFPRGGRELTEDLKRQVCELLVA